jgi:hypothetical protein
LSGRLTSDYSPPIGNAPAFITQMHPDIACTVILASGHVYLFRHTGRAVWLVRSKRLEDPRG